MSETGQSLIRTIRYNLDENLSDQDILSPDLGNKWTNTELLNRVNRAKDRAWQIIRGVREDYFITLGATLSLVAGTKSYNLATGFRQLVAIKCTSSGYETLAFRAVGMDQQEWKERDRIPSGNSPGMELIYCIVSAEPSKFLTADFPPTSLTAEYSYIGTATDYALNGSTSSELPDEVREYMEAYATMMAYGKYSSDPNRKFWEKEVERLEPKLIESVSRRQIRDSKRVTPYLA